MSPISILIVDDEENVRHALRRALRRTPYQLVFADGPAMALELLKKEPVDIVISDHLMPETTGLEFLKLVRDRCPHAIRIMLTGHASMETAIEAINQGEIYRFLTKPWDDTELKITLHLAIEKLTLETENRRLLAAVRAQQNLLKSLEKEHPGIASVVRDDSGAVLLTEEELASFEMH